MAQESVDLVVQWAKDWKLQLNATKSEAAFFSTDPNETGWEPKIQMEEKTIRFERIPGQKPPIQSPLKPS